MLGLPPPASRLSDADIISDAVAWRREIHRHPELAYCEERTASFVSDRLAEAGLDVHRGLARTGVVATLRRGHGGRTIAIRADMDALKGHEQTGLPYQSSTPGVMHACGHDGHVAIALAAARICARMEGLRGTVHFVFQPAEEGAAGARRMIDEGLFDAFPSEHVYALHNWPALPIGTCAVSDGAMMAANAVFEIEVIGRGCHGAMPHQGADPVVAAAHILTALQTISSRNVDPLQSCIVSATQINAGETHNVIPETCRIRGTARWFASDVGDRVESRLGAIARSIAAAMDCSADVQFERRYPATINNADVARAVRALIANEV